MEKNIQQKYNASQQVLLRNNEQIKNLRLIYGNRKIIEQTHDILTRWTAQKTLSPQSLRALTQARLTLNTLEEDQSKLFDNYNSTRATSRKTEFLRLLSALKTVEEKQGLTQVSNLNVRLPKDTPPYSPKPTYLDIELTLSTPNIQ